MLARYFAISATTSKKELLMKMTNNMDRTIHTEILISHISSFNFFPKSGTFSVIFNVITNSMRKYAKAIRIKSRV
jgi:hypothetical protein